MEATDIDFCMVTVFGVLVEAVIPAWKCQYVLMTAEHLEYSSPIDGVLDFLPVAHLELLVERSLDRCAIPIIFVIVVLLPDDRDPLPVIAMPRVLNNLVNNVLTSKVDEHERSIDSK